MSNKRFLSACLYLMTALLLALGDSKGIIGNDEMCQTKREIFIDAWKPIESVLYLLLFNIDNLGDCMLVVFDKGA